MITFVISVILLLLGYWLYSKLIERIIGVDPKRVTPAVAHPDGIDYVPMKPWRIFLIQFLNIAGVGPIIGAVMGAQFGTASFLWAASLPVPYTTSSRASSPSVRTVPRCPKSTVNIWATA